MLVLTRKAAEQISIGDGLITIKVLRITPSRVRLGIDCPADITILRSEVEKHEKGAGDED